MIRDTRGSRGAPGEHEPARPVRPIAPPELTPSLPPESLPLRERAAEFVRFYWFLGIILLALLFFGGLLLFATRESQDPPFVEAIRPEAFADARPAEPPSSEAILSVSTFPFGATVLLDLDSLGTAPISSVSVLPGLYLVSLRLDGYMPVDTLVQLTGSAPQRLFFQMSTSEDATSSLANRDTPRERTPPTPSAARETETSPPRRTEGAADRSRTSPPVVEPARRVTRGSLTFTTDPPGATTILNGRSVGPTPVTAQDLEPGVYEVTFSLAGYEPTTRSFTVRENEAANHGTRLIVSEGTLSVLVRPWGSIFVDGILEKRDTDVLFRTTLPVGRHVIKATHPSLGEITREVEIQRNGETHLVLEFPTD